MFWPMVWLGDQGLGRNMIGVGIKKLRRRDIWINDQNVKDCEGICVLCGYIAEAYCNNQ